VARPAILRSDRVTVLVAAAVVEQAFDLVLAFLGAFHSLQRVTSHELDSAIASTRHCGSFRLATFDGS
jgi:hypothetical protein